MNITGLFRRVKKRLYSMKAMPLYRLNKNELIMIDSDIEFEFRKLDKNDIPEIIKSWVKELGDYSYNDLNALLIDRFEKSIPAYGIFTDSELMGAVWCRKWRYSAPAPQNELKRSFEISNIYINDKARGKRLGSILLYNAINEMFKLKKTIVLSRIYSDRIGSVKLHERVGFKYIGKLKSGFILGFRFNRVVK